MQGSYWITCWLAAAHPEVDAIGLDNQGETVVAWDRFTGEPLSPAIVWQDTRTQPEVDALKAAGHENDIISLTGLPLDSYFSASKIAWLYRIIGNAADLLAEGRLCISTTDAFSCITWPEMVLPTPQPLPEPR